MNQSEMSTTCARHPKVQTNLRCASCGTPICPRCLVQTPVGAKCPNCGSNRGGVLFTPSPSQLTGAVVAGLLTGLVAGWAVEFSLGFYSIFLAFAYGAFAGEMVLRASGRKRGLKMEITTGVFMTLGALGGRIIIGALLLSSPGHVRPPLGIATVLVDLATPSPIPLIALVIVIAAAVSRVRYL